MVGSSSIDYLVDRFAREHSDPSDYYTCKKEPAAYKLLHVATGKYFAFGNKHIWSTPHGAKAAFRLHIGHRVERLWKNVFTTYPNSAEQKEFWEKFWATGTVKIEKV